MENIDQQKAQSGKAKKLEQQAYQYRCWLSQNLSEIIFCHIQSNTEDDEPQNTPKYPLRITIKAYLYTVYIHAFNYNLILAISSFIIFL